MQTSLSIKEPGLNVLPPGVERYVVNAGGITGIQIFPEDEIKIVIQINGKKRAIILEKKGTSKDALIEKIKTI